MEAPDFWNDPDVSQRKMKELKGYKDDVEIYRGLEVKLEDIATLIEMGDEENDPEIVSEVEQEIAEFEETFERDRKSVV